MPKRLLLLLLALVSDHGFAQTAAPPPRVVAPLPPAVRTVLDAARAQTRITTSYDPSYVRLAYPLGDVRPETGVCADVVIRAFRKAGVDLQREVHEDMVRKFKAYPQRWGLKRPDTNIDHRRVPNLMTFFRRAGKELPITDQAGDYLPGDVVAWDLGGGLTHIGIVSDERSRTGRHRIFHNISQGARLEDVLFSWKVIGHYRYFR